MAPQVQLHLNVVVHPTPGPAPQGAGRKGNWGVLRHFVAQNSPNLLVFSPFPREGGKGDGPFEQPHLDVPVPRRKIRKPSSFYLKDIRYLCA